MNRAQEYAEQQVRALGVNPNYSMHERMRLKEFTGYDLQDAYFTSNPTHSLSQMLAIFQ